MEILRKSSVARWRSALMMGSALALLADAAEAQQAGLQVASTNQVEEVIVTAQKREERLLDTPVSVSAVDAPALVANGKLKLQDFFSSVPGLNVQTDGFGHNFLTIRGITNVANATVGVTVDDVPYGGATVYTGANIVPDLDPSDLARIEVLRGPQGTLYGANTLTGLIKYVTTDPSTAGYSGRLEVDAGGVQNGAEPSHGVRAAANIPLSDDVALRVSAFERQDAGFIDNPVLGLDGVNETQVFGGRMSLLWRPVEFVSVKLAAMYQRSDADGNPEVNIGPGLGDLQQNYPANTTRDDMSTALYTANIGVRLGDVQLVSVTGYQYNGLHWRYNETYFIGPRAQATFGVPSGFGTNNRPEKRITQEVRLQGTLWDDLDWQVGGFFSHEKSLSHQDLYASDPNTGKIVGWFWDYLSPGQIYDEIAGFGNVTYRFSDRFDILAGARETQFKTEFEAIHQSGAFSNAPGAPLAGQNPTVAPEVDGTGNAFTYLVTPRFRITPDFMVYARIASGYRPGGVNTAAVRAQGGAPTYQPDTTKSYEAGTKGEFLDGRLAIDASVYYIDWSDIQLGLVAPGGFFYTGNGSGAKSEGVELSATANPLSDLTITGWVSFDDAVLTQSVTNATFYGQKGNRLPNGARWSGYVSVDKQFPVWRDATGFAGGDVSLVGDRIGSFTGSALRQTYPAYAKVDLHAGVELDAWTVTAFVNNVGDRRAAVNGGIGYGEPNTFVYITPRTFGINVTKNF
ncbi:MAG TPA: TonB-dependent receptor [Rhizomicrobium sp.]|nr:TonB-dependent receptor [Rhizomicrobium sp.]